MVGPLRRCFSVLALAVLLVQTTGVANTFGADACEENCPGDDDHGSCPPDCASCVCCPHVRSVATPMIPELLPPVAERLAVLHPTDSPPTAEPRRIEHVPKVSRA